MNILLVGGTFDRERGKESGLIKKLGDSIVALNEGNITICNGGNVERLKQLLDTSPNYDCVFWFANVDNTEEKIRDVKSIAPHTLLVTSKRNDNEKYTFEELLQRALAIKANLCFEFSKVDTIFNIRVFDPLGCVWYDGINIYDATKATLNRLNYLKSVTRKPSIKVGEAPNIEFTETDKKFLEFVRESGETFHRLMCLPPDVKRFVGNASLRFKEPTRCMSGFPAIRKDDVILISRRNVDKTGISEKDFVACYLEDGNVAYKGDNKPSVDSPVQLRLFKQLPNIDYILHGHCYVEDAPMTSMAIPCGAIEEVAETLKCIKQNYYTFENNFYIINLRGHGCLIMANADTLDKMREAKFVVRTIPEFI